MTGSPARIHVDFSDEHLVWRSDISVAEALAMAHAARFDACLVDLAAARGRAADYDRLAALASSASGPCWSAGGVRTAADAESRVLAGAAGIIVGSALFHGGRLEAALLGEMRAAVGEARVQVALDFRGDHLVTHAFERASPVLLSTALDSVANAASSSTVCLCDADAADGTWPARLDGLRALRSRWPTLRFYYAGGLQTRQQVAAVHSAGFAATIGRAAFTDGSELTILPS